MSDYLIWWTNQSDVERIKLLGLDGQLDHWPKYMIDQFAGRNGRAGRGRLWLAKELEGDRPPPPEEADFGPGNPVCLAASECVGYVIRDADLDEVRHLPGFVTTFSMNIVRREKEITSLRARVAELEHERDSLFEANGDAAKLAAQLSARVAELEETIRQIFCKLFFARSE